MGSALTPRGSSRRWRRIRAAIIDRDGGVCQICGKPGARTVDHIERRVDGGGDDPANLRAAHHRCSFVERAGTVEPSRRW
jgi:5-methylcytosine-specific restriction protein A